LMRQLLSNLKPHESFNMLFFSGGSEVFSPKPLIATPTNIQQALASLDDYQGSGGTELVNALETAYAMPGNTDTARSVVVVTDGYINAERDAYDLIAKHLNTTNLFSFGIGSSVNRYLIESMAQAGAGEPFVVTDQNQVPEVGARFRRYVEAPLLSHIHLQGNGVELYDMEPNAIPVMLAERPVVIFGKYRNADDSASLLLTGTAASNSYTVELPINTAQQTDQGELLPILWARHRLMRLSDWAGNAVELNRSAIIDLALKYSLLSRYTSFIAVDEVIANPNRDAKNVQQPLPLPQGVETSALAAQPMPEPELMLLILLLLAGFGLKYWLRDRQHVCQ
jgi:Ca-activated chloride channel family protein